MESRLTIIFSTKHSQFSLLTEYLPLTSHTNAIAVILKTLCDTLMILLATLRLRLFGISDKLQTSKSQVSSALMSALWFEVHISTARLGLRGIKWFTTSCFAPLNITIPLFERFIRVLHFRTPLLANISTFFFIET